MYMVFGIRITGRGLLIRAVIPEENDIQLPRLWRPCMENGRDMLSAFLVFSKIRVCSCCCGRSAGLFPLGMEST